MIYTFEMLDKELLKQQKERTANQCISINGARIIIPTNCNEVVGFTNPDDLDPALLARWKNGERGKEFENQQLQPGDALVMYNNGRNMNILLDKEPNWQTSAEGIKKMIEQLYNCADVGAKMDEPAIWNTNYEWADSVSLGMTNGTKVTENMWREKAGTAMEVIKSPAPQYFILLKPHDKLITPDGREQTADIMSAIAVKQPDGGWNIVQLNPKGYAPVLTPNSNKKYNLDNVTECGIFVRSLMAEAIHSLESLPDEVRKKQQKWLYKKGIEHVHEVHETAKEIAHDKQFLTEVGMNADEATHKLEIIAVLHDVGRENEVDTATGKGKKGFDHAAESYRLLKDYGVDDALVLIPTNLHGRASSTEALASDADFAKLSDADKQKVTALLSAIRDADKIANLKEKTENGVIGSREETDFLNLCTISPKVKESVLAGRAVADNDRNSWIDSMLRFAAWSYDLVYPTAKENVSGAVFDKLFARMDEYAIHSVKGIDNEGKPIPASDEERKALRKEIAEIKQEMSALLNKNSKDKTVKMIPLKVQKEGYFSY